MSRNKPKRFLSILLTLCMVLTMLPVMTLQAFADDGDGPILVSENEDLRVALAKSGKAKIILEKDIDLTYWCDDFSRDRHHEVQWFNAETKNGTVSVFKSLWKYSKTPEFYVVNGIKEVDLNGYEINLMNESSYDYAIMHETSIDRFMFTIKDKASLHIYDNSSSGAGKVYHNGRLSETSAGPLHAGGANIFDVNPGGELVIDGGTYQAGRSSKTWCVSVKDGNGYYNGWAYNMLGGSVIFNFGTVYINGGEFIGHGSYYHSDQNKAVIINRTPDAHTVINGGTFKGVNKDVIYVNAKTPSDNMMLIKGGTFTTEKLKMRYGTQLGSYHSWYVTDVQPYLGMSTAFFDARAGFKYDGATKDYAWAMGVDFKKSSKKLEVLPNSPSLELYDGDNPGELKIMEYDGKNAAGKDMYYCLVAKDASYKIKGEVSPYFSYLGLGRISEVEYSIVNTTKGISIYTGYTKENKFEFELPTGDRGANSYAFTILEELPGSGIVVSNSAYVDSHVVNQPKPVVTIVANENPVGLGTGVTLWAEVDTKKWPIREYEWKNLTTDGDPYVQTDLGGGFISHAYLFEAPNEEVEYLIQCTVTDIYGGKGTDILRLQIGSKDVAPIITTNELVFKYGVDNQTKYVENIGGPVNNNDWKLISDESSLPPGLSFVKSAGLAGFRGKPTEVGVFPVTIEATSGTKSAEKTINIIVSAPVTITTTELPDGAKGEGYEATLEASGGDVKWTIESGMLPSGLDLNIDTGKITGAPNPEYGGLYSFTVKAAASEQQPATKKFDLYINAKPEFITPLSFVVPLGEIARTKKLLKGGTGEISYSISGDAPDGVVVTDEEDLYGAGHIKVNKTVPADTYTFDVTAEGYGDAVTETITLKVEEAPRRTGIALLKLPYGTVGEAYSSGNVISKAIYSNDPNAKWSILSGTLPEGLGFDEDTGVISGTPLANTGKGEDSGYPIGVHLSFKLTDTNEQSEFVASQLYIVDADDNKATTRISFDKDEQVNTATIYAGAVNLLYLYIDGVPVPDCDVVGLPDWMTFDMISNGIAMLTSGLPPQAGSFSFTVSAGNDRNTEKIKEKLTVNIDTLPKADVPTASPLPGMYTKSNLSSGIELKAPYYGESKFVRVYYSVNGSAFKTKNTSSVTLENIEANTIIRAYTDTYFGMGGAERSNSDIVTFEYTVLEDDVVFVSIATDSLLDGTVGTVYSWPLNGSASDSSALTWIVSGLPDGLSLTDGNKITGTPTENAAGDYNVTLIAKAGNSSAKKTLSLRINEKELPDAAKPSITTHPGGATYKIDATAAAMTVSASAGDGGTITYLWYESTDNKNNTPENDTLVGNGSSYTPKTYLPGERYYYAVAVNSMDGYKDAKTSSSVATIKVTFDAATPYFDEGDREYTFTKGTNQIIMDMANVDDEGVLTYEWYKMAGDTPNTSTDDPVTSKDSAKGILEINTPATDGDEETYYAVATNSNDKANGNITAKSDPSPLHIVTATDAVKFEITFDPQTGDDPITLMTGFNGRLEELPGVARGGYIFEGWFTEKSGGTKITLDTYKVVEKEDEIAEIEYEVDVPGYVFDGPTTVYAQWTKKSSGSGGSDVITPGTGDGSQQAELPFIDVKKADWFYDDVYYAYFNKLMMGTSTTTFSPHGNTTRGMIVAILHRMEGSPKAGLDGLFDDVNTKQYYAEPIAWAAANNIVSGYSSDRFGPEDPITREQMAVILMNYAKYKGYDVTASADLSKFSDSGSVSAWAVEAMAWANAETLIQGSGEKLMPLGNAERAQVAAILHRFILKNTK